ncbi:MAG: ribulose-phosphate 3-epimerase, partial [Candidatus Omnitrophica bacterium]|nr:ribulose-phosphate 3-epimerase [Candidatus Omnitrophota bacterium]
IKTEKKSLSGAALSLGTFFKKNGYKTNVSGFDFTQKPTPDEIRNFRQKIRDTDLVCLTVFENDMLMARHVIQMLRGTNPKLIIAVGGPGVTVAPESAFGILGEADIFYRGEIEAGSSHIRNIIDALNAEGALSEENLSAIETGEGIAVRRGNTYIFNNLAGINRVTEAEMNDIDYDFSVFDGLPVKLPLTLITAQGCRHNCAFCVIAGGKKFRAITAENVIQILWKWQNYIEARRAKGESVPEIANMVNILNPDFLFRPAYALGLLRLWKKAQRQGLNLKIGVFETTVTSLLSKKGRVGERSANKRLLKIISSYRGLFYNKRPVIYIGSDALVDEEIVRHNKGPYTLGEVEKVAECCNKLGIWNMHFLILTNPETGIKDLVKTIATMGTLELKYPHTSIFNLDTGMLVPGVEPSFSQKTLNELIKAKKLNLIGENEESLSIAELTRNFPEYRVYSTWDKMPVVINSMYIPPDTISALTNLLRDPISKLCEGSERNLNLQRRFSLLLLEGMLRHFYEYIGNTENQEMSVHYAGLLDEDVGEVLNKLYESAENSVFNAPDITAHIESIKSVKKKIDEALKIAAVREKGDGTGQSGKAVKVKKNTLVLNADKSKGEVEVIDARTKEYLDKIELTREDANPVEIVKMAFRKLEFKDDSHKKAILAILGLLENSPPALYVFEPSKSVKDLSGFDDVKNNLIAVRKDLANNPLFLFHEICHFLINTRCHAPEKDRLLYPVIAEEDGKTFVKIFKHDREGHNVYRIEDIRIFSKTLEAAKKESWPRGWKNDFHYVLRLLQLEIFSERDRDLTSEIRKGREYISDGEVVEFAKDIEKDFFTALWEATLVSRFRSEDDRRVHYVVNKGDRCKIDNGLLAKLLAWRFGLPIGGNEPERIEIVPGYYGEWQNSYHVWIAVYLGGEKPALFIDASYGQFDRKYLGKIISVPYDELYKYRLTEVRMATSSVALDTKKQNEAIRRGEEALPLGRTTSGRMVSAFNRLVEKLREKGKCPSTATAEYSGKPVPEGFTINPSLLPLSKNPENFAPKAKEAEAFGAGMMHYDVMDGRFVEASNWRDVFTPERARKLAASLDIPLDTHLMVKNPYDFIDLYIDASDIITIHRESFEEGEKGERALIEVLKYIRNRGKKAGVALNPDTVVEKVKNALPHAYMVLLMSVYPGKGNQNFMPEVLYKVKKLREAGFNGIIEMDGGIKQKEAKEAASAGIKILVSGSGVFNDKATVESNIATLKKAIGEVTLPGEMSSEEPFKQLAFPFDDRGIDPMISGNNLGVSMTREEHEKRQSILRRQVGEIVAALERECKKYDITIRRYKVRGTGTLRFDIYSAVRVLLKILEDPRFTDTSSLRKAGKPNEFIIGTETLGEVHIGMEHTLGIGPAEEAYKIVTIINEKLDLDHAGRDSLTIYARSERKAVHERTELWHWIHFARNPRRYGIPIDEIASEDDINDGKLGGRIVNWASQEYSRMLAEYEFKKEEGTLPANAERPRIEDTTAYKLKKHFHLCAARDEFDYMMRQDVKNRKISRELKDLACSKLSNNAKTYISENDLNLRILLPSWKEDSIELSEDSELIISRGTLEKHTSQWVEKRILYQMHYLNELRVLVREENLDESGTYRRIYEMISQVLARILYYENLLRDVKDGEFLQPDLMQEARQWQALDLAGAEVERFVLKEAVARLYRDDRSAVEEISSGLIATIGELRIKLKERLAVKEKPAALPASVTLDPSIDGRHKKLSIDAPAKKASGGRNRQIAPEEMSAKKASLLGEVYRDITRLKPATCGIEAMENEGQLTLCGTNGTKLYISNGRVASTRILNKQEEPGIKIITSNGYLFVFACDSGIYVAKNVLDEELIRYYVERIKHYAEKGVHDAASGISVHLLIRGCDEHTREAFERGLADKVISSDCTGDRLIRYFKSGGLEPERQNEDEFNLIKYNASQFGLKGESLLCGELDRKFRTVSGGYIITRCIKWTLICKRLFEVIEGRKIKNYEELAEWMSNNERSAREKASYPARVPASCKQFIGDKDELRRIGVELGFCKPKKPQDESTEGDDVDDSFATYPAAALGLHLGTSVNKAFARAVLARIYFRIGGAEELVRLIRCITGRGKLGICESGGCDKKNNFEEHFISVQRLETLLDMDRENLGRVFNEINNNSAYAEDMRVFEKNNIGQRVLGSLDITAPPEEITFGEDLFLKPLDRNRE